MRYNRSLVVASILLAAAVIIPRIYAGAVEVKYDSLFWDSQGGGYAPTEIAGLAKLLSCFLALAASVMLFRNRDRRVAWFLMMTVSVSSFLSISALSDRDLPLIIRRGNLLISQIESYKNRKSHYPSSLKALHAVPKTSLAKERRFFYVTARNSIDDKGPWFPSTRRYLGKSPYVICVPLVPVGTLVYRPNNEYSDLIGRSLSGGWYMTSND